jgi:hypothetical protein
MNEINHYEIVRDFIKSVPDGGAKARRALLALSIIASDPWRPIDDHARDGNNYLLAAYIVPSETAQINGSRPFWDVAYGCYWAGSFTSILGGKPSHYKIVTPPMSDGFLDVIAMEEQNEK